MSVQSRRVALNILNNVESNGAYSNIEINRAIGQEKLSQIDKALMTQLVYGVLEYKYTIDWIVTKFSSIKINRISIPILNIIRMGIYQLLYLDKIPDYSAVNESVSLAKKFGHSGSVKFVNGILRTVSREKDNIQFPSKKEDIVKYMEIQYSHPRWIVEKLLNQYGSQVTEDILRSNNQKNNLTLRVNTIKTNRISLIETLLKKGWTVFEGDLEESIIVDKGINIFDSEEFKKGLFFVQDQSSMLVSKVLDPKPGQMVIDCCSAPGGKSTHMAQLMENRGKIIARDIYKHKLNLILDNCNKLSIDIVDTQLFDAMKLDASMDGKADAVLVDAPCSGLGIISKKPEIKWNKNADDIEAISKLQLKILETNSSLVKKNGVLVYSTCTILDQENHNVMKEFLDRNKNFKTVDISNYIRESVYSQTSTDGYIQILQTRENFDGFFIAKMIRID